MTFDIGGELIATSAATRKAKGKHRAPQTFRGITMAHSSSASSPKHLDRFVFLKLTAPNPK
jgi:hypothetical protein